MPTTYRTRKKPAEIYSRLGEDCNRIILDMEPMNGLEATPAEQVMALGIDRPPRCWTCPQKEEYKEIAVGKDFLPRKISIYADGYTMREQNDGDGSRWKDTYGNLKNLVSHLSKRGYTITRLKVGLNCDAPSDWGVYWEGEFELRGREGLIEVSHFDKRTLKERFGIDDLEPVK